MDKETVRNNRKKVVFRFIYIALMGCFLVLLFDSESSNDLLGWAFFTMSWSIKTLHFGIKERADGNHNRALFQFVMSFIGGLIIVAVGVIYLFDL
ncbi:hypothetical protein [Bacillus sp. es.036]|uniref:hypothetical protein n=1 Tax=Bacillus sp. es.036 TaxID=1761764 RepID=UPI000BF7905A|nr:hypothetical protein [Bacillus sp. es.036]PFG15056.1 hypothetical protein ATG70_3302 [Bacillus sp. es.036]